MQRRAAADRDMSAARAGNLRASAAQKASQINDLRLPRRIPYLRASGAAGRRQHGVLGRADAGKRQRDFRRGQRLCLRADIPALRLHPRAHRAERHQMQVDGPCAQWAAARKRQPRLSPSRQHRPEKHNRRAHFSGQLHGDLAAVHPGCVHKKASAPALRTAAEAFQNFQCGIHVLDLRTVM